MAALLSYSGFTIIIVILVSLFCSVSPCIAISVSQDWYDQAIISYRLELDQHLGWNRGGVAALLVLRLHYSVFSVCISNTYAYNYCH